ncbi:MAG TPA: cupin domain-containing protein [Longimicrobiaceae bacterium]|nr:cupin domain-containing protein [Longimicrobiaceae bacterium]
MVRFVLVLAAVLTFAPAVLSAQDPQGTAPSEHLLLAPNELQWSAGPASLPAGARVAVLEGNPAEPGPFTIRLEMPDGYQIPPHWHPGIEHVSVLSGVFVVGQGEEVNTDRMKELPQGGFMMMPPEMPHYAHTRGETVLQLHGMGPWGITYIDPADDPRRQ